MVTKTLGVLLRCRRDKRALYMSVSRGQLFHNPSMSVAYMEVQMTALSFDSFISTPEVNGVYSGPRLTLNPGTQALHKYNFEVLYSNISSFCYFIHCLAEADLSLVMLRWTISWSSAVTSWIDDWSTATARRHEGWCQSTQIPARNPLIRWKKKAKFHSFQLFLYVVKWPN